MMNQAHGGIAPSPGRQTAALVTAVERVEGEALNTNAAKGGAAVINEFAALLSTVGPSASDRVTWEAEEDRQVLSGAPIDQKEHSENDNHGEEKILADPQPDVETGQFPASDDQEVSTGEARVSLDPGQVPMDFDLHDGGQQNRRLEEVKTPRGGVDQEPESEPPPIALATAAGSELARHLVELPETTGQGEVSRTVVRSSTAEFTALRGPVEPQSLSEPMLVSQTPDPEAPNLPPASLKVDSVDLAGLSVTRAQSSDPGSATQTLDLNPPSATFPGVTDPNRTAPLTSAPQESSEWAFDGLHLTPGQGNPSGELASEKPVSRFYAGGSEQAKKAPDLLVPSKETGVSGGQLRPTGAGLETAAFVSLERGPNAGLEAEAWPSVHAAMEPTFQRRNGTESPLTAEPDASVLKSVPHPDMSAPSARLAGEHNGPASAPGELSSSLNVAQIESEGVLRDKVDNLARGITASPVRAELEATRAVVAQVRDVILSQQARLTEVQLSPEDLGRVRFSFSSGESAQLVSIQVERAETLELIRRNLDMLRSELQDAGYEMADTDLLKDFDRRSGQELFADEFALEAQLDEQDAAALVDQTPQNARNALVQGRLDLRL